MSYPVPALQTPAPLRPMAPDMDGDEGQAALAPPAPTYTPDLAKLRDWFWNYEQNKRDELKERDEALGYYHGLRQWSDAERAVLRRRKQAPIFDNRIGRKIDFLVGVEQRMRRDPKGYPRTPRSEQDADTATAALRYACDRNRWEWKGSSGTHDGLVEGIGVCEIAYEQTPDGLEPVINEVDADRFFYDPRSRRHDFSDARYLGLHLWLDIDDAVDMFPQAEAQLRSLIDTDGGRGAGVSYVDNRQEMNWANFEGRRVRVVCMYEKTKAGWAYCCFTAGVNLESGMSEYLDEYGRPEHPYEAWSPYIDEKGIRYSPIRNMRPMQDEVNHRRSKFLHLLNTRQIFYAEGTVDDVDEMSRELSKPDGKIKITQGEWGKNIGIVDTAAEIQGQAQLLEQSQSALENLGPNPGLIGKGGGVADQSGRAILAQRDSGMTELSPVFEHNRDWKLRVYKKLWSRCRQTWKAEKWIRVTDDEGSVKFVGLNQFSIDPQSGGIVSQNVIAHLDVDIIMEEGPDTITMNEELLDKLSQLPPGSVPAKVLIELSNAPKKEYLFKLIDEASQPDPVAKELGIRMHRIEQLLAAAKVDQVNADAQNKRMTALAALLKAATPAAPQTNTDPATGAQTTTPSPQPDMAMVQGLLALMAAMPQHGEIESEALSAGRPQPPPVDKNGKPLKGPPAQQAQAPAPADTPPPGTELPGQMPGGLPINPALAAAGAMQPA